MAKSIDVFQASSKLLKKALDNILFIRIIKRIKVKEGELSAKVGSNGQRKVMAGKKGAVSATRSATMQRLGLRNATQPGQPIKFYAYVKKKDRKLLEEYFQTAHGRTATEEDLKDIVRGWLHSGLNTVRHSLGSKGSGGKQASKENNEMSATLFYMAQSEFKPKVSPPDIGLLAATIFETPVWLCQWNGRADEAVEMAGDLLFGKHELAHRVYTSEKALPGLLALSEDERSDYIRERIIERQSELELKNSEEYAESLLYLEAMRWFFTYAHKLII